MSPYLQLLLQKRPQLYPDYDPANPEPPDEPQIAVDSPPATIPLKARPMPDAQANPMPDVVPSQFVAQRPTIPMQPRTAAPVVMGTPTDYVAPDTPAVPLKPRDRIEEDRQRLINAQNKKGPSLGKRILEGVGDYAASGIGLNLNHILHPRGTEVQQAQRQLQADLGIQNQQTENQDKQSLITLRGKQADQIDQNLAGPTPAELADAAKKEARANFIESMKLHPQPLDPNDPADQELLRQAKVAGILLPNSYGKQPKSDKKLIAGRTKLLGGKNVYVDDNGDAINDSEGDPIVHGMAPADKTGGETQEEADKREAERQSLQTKADSLRGLAGSVDAQLRGKDGKSGLYAEQGNYQSQIQQLTPRVTAANATDADKAAYSQAKESLRVVNERIQGLETQRNKHIANATEAETEALKFKREPKAASSNFTAPANSRGRKWSKAAFAKSNPAADAEAAAKTMAAAGAKVVD